jgi:two-component system, NarL family, nitrate/nitrite response regulator NarL
VTIEPLQSAHGSRQASTGRQARPLPSARTSPEQPVRTPSCVSVQDIGDAEGPALLFALRRRGVPRIVVLARRASRTELPVLLAGGVRGVIAGQVMPSLVRGAAAPTSTLPDLSAREVGVLKLVADGMSNRQIGEELGLSALTVKSHLARISRKLGTGDRAELVAKVMRAGLVA